MWRPELFHGPSSRPTLTIAVLALALAAVLPVRAQEQAAPTPQTHEAPAATSEPAAAPHDAHAAPSAEAAAPPTQAGPAGEATPALLAKAPQLKFSGDLSPWGMFVHAHVIVKAVMIGLALASVATWTIALAKIVELVAARRRARRGLESLAGAPDLAAAAQALSGRASPIARFVAAAQDEWARSSGLPPEGVKERVGALLSRLEAQAGRRAAFGTTIIATIGATAPFVGLFGTVWGIMDSFIGIAKTQTTNLAVVAPGIAEALLATALGLVAAIPAVMIYNMFARWIAGYRALLGDASAEVMRHLSRDLDRALEPDVQRDRQIVAIRRPAE
ncbi:tonB-system energizer ExbB [Methylocella sp.]|uniref:tonB-system energizer ExbB n=1 Tax=Methylocella sp. TaxID=1978226 RepID=UPI003783E287